MTMMKPLDLGIWDICKETQHLMLICLNGSKPIITIFFGEDTSITQAIFAGTIDELDRGKTTRSRTVDFH